MTSIVDETAAVVERLRAAYTSWNNPPSDGVPDGAGVLMEAKAEITRLRTLLSSSRGEQGCADLKAATNWIACLEDTIREGLAYVRSGMSETAAFEMERVLKDPGCLVQRPSFLPPLPSAPGSVPTSQMRPHGGIAACYDCNRPYGDEFGFPDLVLPNDVWSAISPTKNEGGLLCPSCICKRLHSAGIETHGVFRSGPLSETSLAGHKILEGLRDAVAGDLPRVTIEGVTYVRQDAGSPEALLAASRQTIIDLQTELDVLKAAFTGGADHG